MTDLLNEVQSNLDNGVTVSLVTWKKVLEVAISQQWALRERNRNADRYQWMKAGGIYKLPYDDHGAGPEYDIDAWDSTIDADLVSGAQA